MRESLAGERALYEFLPIPVVSWEKSNPVASRKHLNKLYKKSFFESKILPKFKGMSLRNIETTFRAKRHSLRNVRGPTNT